VGTQNGFSWKEVAVSAVTSAVSIEAMKGIQGSEWIKSLGGTRAQQAFTNAAGSVVSAGMRVALGGRVDFQSVLADIAGNMIGNSIVAKVGAAGSSAGGSSSSDDGLEEFTPTVAKVPLSVNPDIPFIDTMPDLGMTAGGSLQDLANIPMPDINLGPSTYTVKGGDALEKIARANGMGPEGAAAIAKASGINVGDVIRPGQKLVIPDSYNSVAAKNEYGKYLADVNAVKAQAVTAAASTAAEKVVRDAGLIVTAHGGDPSFVYKNLRLLPKDVLSTLGAGGVKVVAVRDSVVEFQPEDKGVVPRGWESTGLTWDNVPSLYNPNTNTVIIGTSGKFPTGSVNFTLHEFGHAYDTVLGDASSDGAFLQAYAADRPFLSTYQQQAGVAGRQEAFAESFANYYGGNPGYSESNPNLYLYWKSRSTPK
jgi:LysM repeat protein